MSQKCDHNYEASVPIFLCPPFNMGGRGPRSSELKTDLRIYFELNDLCFDRRQGGRSL